MISGRRMFKKTIGTFFLQQLFSTTLLKDVKQKMANGKLAKIINLLGRWPCFL